MLSVVLWCLALVVVAVAAFVAGVAFGRGFWRDVRWIQSRR